MIYKRIIIIASFLMPFMALGQTLRTVAQWEALFVQNWDKEYKIAKAQSTSKDSWQYYNLAYSIDANTCMFQASGNTKYLDRELEYINDMMDSAVPSSQLPKSQFKDNYLGWANFSAPSQGNDGKEYPLFESFCWRYVTRLLVVLNKSPKLLEQEKYKAEYTKILDFTTQNIFNKWANRGMSNIYRSNTHMSSHWARISMDLWLITNDRKYIQIFDKFNDQLRGQIKPNPRDISAYWWNIQWRKFLRPGQDVAHGNAIIGEIVESYDAGLGYRKADIDALIKLFGKVIWPSNNVYAKYFDGSGEGSGWFSDGFIKLGRYDKALQLRIENHTRGRSTQFYGNGALNAAILINGRPVYPLTTN